MSGNTLVMKGEILRRADANLNAPDETQGDNLKNNPLWDAGVDQAVLRPADEQHVKNDWFGADWWPGIPDKDRILSSAYVKAIELSTKDGNRLPIRSLWISGVVDHFEVAVMPSPEQVTVVLITPPHPDTPFPPAAQTFTDTVWLVASEARVNQVRDSYPNAYNVPAAEEPIPGNGVKAQELIGY